MKENLYKQALSPAQTQRILEKWKTYQELVYGAAGIFESGLIARLHKESRSESEIQNALDQIRQNRREYYKIINRPASQTVPTYDTIHPEKLTRKQRKAVIKSQSR